MHKALFGNFRQGLTTRYRLTFVSNPLEMVEHALQVAALRCDASSLAMLQIFFCELLPAARAAASRGSRFPDVPVCIDQYSDSYAPLRRHAWTATRKTRSGPP